MQRTIIGLMISPLWVPILSTARAALFAKPPEFLKLNQTAWILDNGAIGLAIGYGAAVVLGLPAYLLLRRGGGSSAAAYAAAGLLCGALTWILGIFASGLKGQDFAFMAREIADTVAARPYLPASFCLIGALVAVTFWAIARPDRTRGDVGVAFE